MSNEITGEMPAGARWPVYVINLAGAHDRLASVTAELQRLGMRFQRIDAVGPADITESMLARVYDRARNRRVAKAPLSRPEIACYLSHIKAWREAAASPAGGAIVLEDDFTAHPMLPAIVDAIAAPAPDWDIVKLYSTAMTSGKTVRPLADDFSLVAARVVPPRTIAYAIAAPAARRLADTAMPFARPVDQDIKHWWEKDLRVLSVVPSVVGLDDRHLETSSIEKERVQSKGGAFAGLMLRRLFRNLRYQVNFRAGLIASQWRRP